MNAKSDVILAICCQKKKYTACAGDIIVNTHM